MRCGTEGWDLPERSKIAEVSFTPDRSYFPASLSSASLPIGLPPIQLNVYFFTAPTGSPRTRLHLVSLIALGLACASVQLAGAQSVLTGDVTPCEEGTAGSYPCDNVDLLAYMPIAAVGGGYNVGINDIWGWTDPQTGTEYVLLGRTDGIAFVDVSTPSDPLYIGELPTHSRHSVWRDVKVYENHAFVVSEASNHGMQVFDLTNLRDVTASDGPVTFEETAHYDALERAHNLVIDTATGFAYIVGGSGYGSTCGGGLHMVDLEDPTDPSFAGCFADPSTGRAGTGYTHDAQCVVYQGPDADYQGREVCFNANETAVNIADVTNKNEPGTISNANYPQVGYTHQVWLTEGHRYLYVDDELDEGRGYVDRTRTLVFDVTDLDNPELATSYLGETSAIDHNQYIKGNYSYQANYESGLRILDVSAPESPAEVGFFDTYPESDTTSFQGAWSVYPFFDRNFVVVSGIEEGLFVLRPNVSPILSVKGHRDGQNVRLEWSISSTAKTDRIEVEHMRPEGSNWMGEGSVEGRAGGSVATYQLVISNLEPGTHRFRIRHVSADGTVHVSESVGVPVVPSDAYVATGPYPNPAGNDATFKITLREAQHLRVVLYDAMGRRVRVLRDRQVPSGVIQRFRVRARDRASGVYFLRVRGESFRLTRKVVVAR